MEKLFDKRKQNEIKEILEEVTEPVQILLFKDNGKFSELTEQEFVELSELNDKIKVKVYDSDSEEINKYNIEKGMFPVSLMLDNKGNDFGIRYYGTLAGYQLTTLLYDIIAMSNKDIYYFTKKHKKQLRKINKEIKVKVFITPNCWSCIPATFMAHQAAMLNPNITGEMIESNEFKDIVFKYNVFYVPHIVIEVKEDDKWVIKYQMTTILSDDEFVEKIINI